MDNPWRPVISDKTENQTIPKFSTRRIHGSLELIGWTLRMVTDWVALFKAVLR